MAKQNDSFSSGGIGFGADIETFNCQQMPIETDEKELFDMAAKDRKKIIIDTDCGIDDAVALILALGSKDIAEVLAITCCFGNTSIDNVCSNVMRVLTVCGETTIPIHRGCKGPLIARHQPDTVHGSDGLGNCAHEFPTGDLKESKIPAALALINLAKKYPKEITLIAIGPLTNLAVAHRIDPSFTENLKSIVIMGGNYKGIGNITEVAEFNFYCDPESANIVVSEAACSITLVPWETTMEYGIQWADYYELIKINTPKCYFFKQITEYAVDRGLKKGNKQLYDCDFLAIVAELYPQSLKSSIKSHLQVECGDGITTGMMVLSHESSSNANRRKIEIFTHYDKEFLKALLVRMFS